MDTKDASTYTGLSEKTLAMMRCHGNGPKFVKRGRIFYFTADVDEWLNAQGRLTSTSKPSGVGLEATTMRMDGRQKSQRGHFDRARLPESIRVESYSPIAVYRAKAIAARWLEAADGIRPF